MKFYIYAMRDLKSGFLAPTIDSNDSVAIRAFDTMCRRSSDVMHFHPEDFELYKLGSFDTDTAEIKLFDVRELIFEGKDVLYEK